jgi:hypothetical protein
LLVDLICYLHPGWLPLIRPAPATRTWMDATSESFAYRCLPLNIANAHGWELLSPCTFDAIWDGGTGTDAVTIDLAQGADPGRVPVSLFGHGVLTFHVEGIFRTPPGWDLWVSGSPNRAKDGIAPLTAIVETDWSPFTFTMNWQFTRPGQSVHFDAMEPICFMFPIQRGAIEAFQPKFEPLGADPATSERFAAWSRARDDFHRRLAALAPAAQADRWQKHYYRGVDVNDESLIADHRTKLHLLPFDRTATPQVAAAPDHDAPRERPASAQKPSVAAQQSAASSAELAAARLALAKREWLLETIERQRALVPALVAIDWRSGLSSEEFLERYYAQNRPVIIAGELDDWPALSRWTPEYVKATVGAEPVEFQGGRSLNPNFEMFKEVHRREAPFDVFMDHILRPGAGNDAYLTAFNSARNVHSLSALQADIGELDKFLDYSAGGPKGMMWIGPAGTFTSLHHDLTNNFITQVVGRKQIKLMPAGEVGKLYNRNHVFSEITDIDAGEIDIERYGRLPELRIYDVVLQPGEILFTPIGWWHQVRALDFSITLTNTNFLWPNEAHATYPGC